MRHPRIALVVLIATAFLGAGCAPHIVEIPHRTKSITDHELARQLWGKARTYGYRVDYSVHTVTCEIPDLTATFRSGALVTLTIAAESKICRPDRLFEIGADAMTHFADYAPTIEALFDFDGVCHANYRVSSLFHPEYGFPTRVSCNFFPTANIDASFSITRFEVL